MTEKDRDLASDQSDRSAERTSHHRKERDPKPVFRPAPGVKHVPEPDAENIIPAEDEPGTL